MKNAVVRVSLDISKTGSQINIPMFHGDTKRTFIFSFTDNGKPYQLEEDCLVVFTGKKSDGNLLYNACEVDVEKNVAVYNLDENDANRQTTACVGMVECQLVVMKREEIDGAVEQRQVASSYFNITVMKTVYNEEEIVDSEIAMGMLEKLFVPVTRSINGIGLNKNISREQLFNGLFVIKSFAPKKGDKGYTGELILVGLEQGNREPYICIGYYNDGGYNWQKIVLSKDIANYVSNTLKIAGLSLQTDITVAQLQNALGIGNIETALDSIIEMQENLIGGATE